MGKVMLIGLAPVSYYGAKIAAKAAANVKRTLSYDKKLKEPLLSKEDKKLPWYKRGLKLAKNFVKKQVRKVTTGGRLLLLRGHKFFDIMYGTIRDFWLDSGALDLFNNSTIMGTAGAAIPLLQFLLDKGILKKAPSAENSNPIHDLMFWFYNYAGIKGYDWKQVVGDAPS